MLTQSSLRQLGRTDRVFDFPLEIRKIIYTTNLIENLNGKSENTPKIKCLSLRMMLS